ncbi:hypothetical protein CAOG_01013 [Capsaspora owczarzaki ATCC 30864]|uniref:Rho guanine nucleotide exchange factor n=1 Tax=Capsaspora owczarzaki (strain ATCC 30864) TaxID=595528 RepID=A0A0D2WIC4_CAPO3|nr:hypothetical protein CAOG_01013 [Capsaspora owczarzaki ATCC 30864]KJE89569.1 hypothetical protein CAOG_001013 [Capsaspora owczarzaki ATCC 30864]KJE89570.1 hypothetical protein, variant [Capsaspora owczarzaki ATCC 30864]|eukprot:XP_004365884.2 hypothetical protein CAOG_01013 [Capsaspora owczarzaki ATCC 30864]
MSSSAGDFPNTSPTRSGTASGSAVSSPSAAGTSSSGASSGASSSGSDVIDFTSLEAIQGSPVHLAVFVNYLLTSSLPEALFFHLSVEQFKLIKNAKERVEAAQGIFKTYLAAGSLLQLEFEPSNSSVSDFALRVSMIEAALNSGKLKDKELPSIFDPVEKLAYTSIASSLDVFRQSLALGLGEYYGASRIGEMKKDDKANTKLVVELLRKHLSVHIDNQEEEEEGTIDPNDTDYQRSVQICHFLITYLQKIGCDKSFFEEFKPNTKSRRDSMLSRMSTKSKKVHVIEGHQFVATHWNTPTFCDSCTDMLWGFGNQGYQCKVCGFNCHKRACSKNPVDKCTGTKLKRDKRPAPVFDTLKVARSTPRSTVLGGSNSRSDILSSLSPDDAASADNTSLKSVESEDDVRIDRSHSPQPHDATTENGRDADTISETSTSSAPSESQDGAPAESPDGHVRTHQRNVSVGSNSDIKAASGLKSSPSILRKLPTLRKSARSNPQVPDADVLNSSPEHLSAELASSTPSLVSSGSIDETSSVHGAEASSAATPEDGMSLSSAHSASLSNISATCWSDTVTNWEALAHLSKKEIKRQEVIFELVKTERNFVSNLEIMQETFMHQLLRTAKAHRDQIVSVFANIEELLKLNRELCQRLEARQREAIVVEQIGDIFLSMFEKFDIYAVFCANQINAMEEIGSLKKRSNTFAQALKDCEANPRANRMVLTEYLPMPMQRLTRYPLLLETVIGCTPKQHKDHSAMLQAVRVVKGVVTLVNERVAQSVAAQRLSRLQKSLDTSHLGYTIDLLKNRRAIQLEGELTLTAYQSTRKKNLLVHAMLLNDYMLATMKKDSNTITLALDPLPLFGSLVRNVESKTTRCAFFVVVTQAGPPQMLEFVAATEFEKKNWMDSIKATIALNTVRPESLIVKTAAPVSSTSSSSSLANSLSAAVSAVSAAAAFSSSIKDSGDKKASAVFAAAAASAAKKGEAAKGEPAKGEPAKGEPAKVEANGRPSVGAVSVPAAVTAPAASPTSKGASPNAKPATATPAAATPAATSAAPSAAPASSPAPVAASAVAPAAPTTASVTVVNVEPAGTAVVVSAPAVVVEEKPVPTILAPPEAPIVSAEQLAQTAVEEALADAAGNVPEVVEQLFAKLQQKDETLLRLVEEKRALLAQFRAWRVAAYPILVTEDAGSPGVLSKSGSTTNLDLPVADDVDVLSDQGEQDETADGTTDGSTDSGRRRDGKRISITRRKRSSVNSNSIRSRRLRNSTAASDDAASGVDAALDTASYTSNVLHLSSERQLSDIIYLHEKIADSATTVITQQTTIDHLKTQLASANTRIAALENQLALLENESKNQSGNIPVISVTGDSEPTSPAPPSFLAASIFIPKPQDAASASNNDDASTTEVVPEDAPAAEQDAATEDADEDSRWSLFSLQTTAAKLSDDEVLAVSPGVDASPFELVSRVTIELDTPLAVEPESSQAASPQPDDVVVVEAETVAVVEAVAVAEPAEPAVAEPAVVEPAVAEPVAAEPVVAEPVAAEPVAAELPSDSSEATAVAEAPASAESTATSEPSTPVPAAEIAPKELKVAAAASPSGAAKKKKNKKKGKGGKASTSGASASAAAQAVDDGADDESVA